MLIRSSVGDGPPGLDDPLGVGVVVDKGLHHGFDVAVVAALAPHQGVGPLEQRRVVGIVDAQGVADHLEGQPGRDVGHEIAVAGGGHRVDEAVGVRARIEGSRRTRKAAVYELLGWNEGRFAFTQTDPGDIDDEIGAPTTMLLIEAARRADELENGHAP